MHPRSLRRNPEHPAARKGPVALRRCSPRNELTIKPSNWRDRLATDRAAAMLRHLSSFPSCTVLRLSGQFCIPVDFFDSLSAVANPFPALNVFHLDIGPDTSDGKWFFVKDETKLAWEKARQGPERANYVQCTEDGIFPSNPSHPTSPAGMTTATGHTWRPSYDEFAYLEEKDLLRSWTLPDDETVNPMLRGATGAMGRGPKIEQFTVRLSDNFDNVVCDVNCVW